MSKPSVVRRAFRWVADQILGAIWAWIASLAVTIFAIALAWLRGVPDYLYPAVFATTFLSVLAAILATIRAHDWWRSRHPSMPDIDVEIQQIEKQTAIIKQNAAHMEADAAWLKEMEARSSFLRNKS